MDGLSWKIGLQEILAEYETVLSCCNWGNQGRKLWIEAHAFSTFLSKSIRDMNNYGARKEWDVLCAIRHTGKEKCKTGFFFFCKEQCRKKKKTPLIFH